jgi:hypothetical protein
MSRTHCALPVLVGSSELLERVPSVIFYRNFLRVTRVLAASFCTFELFTALFTQKSLQGSVGALLAKPRQLEFASGDQESKTLSARHLLSTLYLPCRGQWCNLHEPLFRDGSCARKTFLATTLAAELEGSTPLISNPVIGHGPEPVLFTYLLKIHRNILYPLRSEWTFLKTLSCRTFIRTPCIPHPSHKPIPPWPPVFHCPHNTRFPV